MPKTNTEFWVAKVARNQARDQDVWRQLEAKGWGVLIVWECQLKKDLFDGTVTQVAEEIIKNGELHRQAVEERRAEREAYLQERRARREKEVALLEEVKPIKKSHHFSCISEKHP